MHDPLSDVVRLLRPRAVFAKGISGAGRWSVRYSQFGDPSFCVVLEGRCTLAVDGEAVIALEAGDFVLLPATPGFTLSAQEGVLLPTLLDPRQIPSSTDDVRHGRQDGPADVRLFGGWFQFDADAPAMLESLLPGVVHVRGVPRLSLLVGLVGEEVRNDQPGREVVLSHLVGMLLVEALRETARGSRSSGLLRGLADARLTAALRSIHERPAHSWTIAKLADTAALSRSAFFDRFSRTLGVAPMEYVLAWRMALARDLLRHHDASVADVAERVGYNSTSTFSTAFRRHVGASPMQYARAARSD
ncbi:AraC family transcriptional regulator [Lysobacter sp. MMG2]|uniref:AraC family transcriptional regulator n=1 Tax=Lysobacter sp. MMG2 TaxID=2801338 RepID=UPI001C224799|nr:AraC family transcriptional regulator [Lysobacter sp. MMG2]MBU8974552.1 AraC family transcriptional regulator [Lysobacter sp. MMG2]